MALPVTALYAGILALWVVFLLFQVVGFRRGEKVALGDGGSDHGQRLIRAHANATETIPLFLILLGLTEGLGAPSYALHLLGGIFTLGRIVHGVHFMKARPGITLRFVGMILTIIAMTMAALGLIAHAVT